MYRFRKQPSFPSLSMMKMTDQPRPLGLYLHIPFCKERCSYCDFLTFAHAEEWQNAYIEALCREMETLSRRGFFIPYEVDTIYIGGGTPSILPAHLLEKLTLSIRKFILFDAQKGPKEWTIEANPGNLNEEKMEILKKAGVNRISLGVQTTNPFLLHQCHRSYKKEGILRELEDLKNAGIRRINMDFIYGFPGQTTETIKEDLSFIRQACPGHLSWYSLILEEKTLLKYWIDQKTLLPLKEEEELRLMNCAFEGLQDLGYQRYEISNFAFPGEESLHNLKYWSGEEYLGLGLGAASYIQKERVNEERNLHLYISKAMEGKRTWTREKRTPEEDLFEQVMMGFRKTKGILFSDFEKKNHRSLLSFGGEYFQKAKKEGLLDWDEQRAWLSPRGLLLQNLFLSDFLLFLEKNPRP